MRDLTNQTFGWLTALAPLARRDSGGSVLWRCRCRCGELTDVDEYSLVSGNTCSCGCKRRSAMLGVRARQTYIDGTCIDILENRKHRSDNTSGFRGVMQVRPGKWRVLIGFQGKQHHVGYYDSFDRAVQARMEAEEFYFGTYLREYYADRQAAEV